MSENTETEQVDEPSKRRKPKRTDPIRMPTWLAFSILILTVSGAVMMVRRDDPVAAMSIVAIAMSGWIGFSMGLGRIVASILAIIATFWFAPSLGIAFEDQATEYLGTTGLTNRLICIGLSGLAIFSGITFVATLISNRFLSKRRRLNTLNSYLGFSVALAEGVVLMWLVLGSLLSLQMWQRDQDIDNNRVAQLVDHWASKTRQSALGPTIRDYNPLERIDALSSVGDVHQAVRKFKDPDSIDRLLNDPGIRALKSDPDFAAAIEDIRRDPSVNEIIKGGAPMTGQSLIKLMNSPSVLRLLDHPDFLEQSRKIIHRMK